MAVKPKPQQSWVSSILRHSDIWGAADEVLNKVHKKSKTFKAAKEENLCNVLIQNFSSLKKSESILFFANQDAHRTAKNVLIRKPALDASTVRSRNKNLFAFIKKTLSSKWCSLWAAAGQGGTHHRAGRLCERGSAPPTASQYALLSSWIKKGRQEFLFLTLVRISPCWAWYQRY